MVKPQDKEMKMQWITVDGRRTPVILPQIWDHEKEDWVVTSTENPLPTQVTGSIVEKALEIKDRTWSGGGLIWGYISNNDDLDGPRSVRPVDVSGYRDKSIYIKNDYDVTLNSIRVYGLSEARNRGEDSISRDDYTLFYFDVGHEVDPGESLYITSDEYPGLKKTSIGLLVRVRNKDGTEVNGGMDVIIFGIN